MSSMDYPFQPEYNKGTEMFIAENGFDFYLEHHHKYIGQSPIPPYLVRLATPYEWKNLKFVDESQERYFNDHRETCNLLYSLAKKSNNIDEMEELKKVYKCIQI